MLVSRQTNLVNSVIKDPFTDALTVIGEPHRMTHDGFMFNASAKITGLVDAGVYDLLFNVPALTFPHLTRVSFAFGRGDIDFLAYEGTTTSADGTASASQNTNRNSSNTPGMSLHDSPTVTDVGTLIYTRWVPPTSTGTGLSAEGVDNVEQGTEWVLKPSTKYLMRITNNSGATVAFSTNTFWYEVGATA